MGTAAEACGDVERCAAKAVGDLDRFARVDAHPHLERYVRVRPCFVAEPRLEVHSRADRLPSRREDDERFVSSQLDELTVMGLDAVRDELGELGGELGCRFVAVLLRVPGIPPDVGDQKRAQSGRRVAHVSSMPLPVVLPELGDSDACPSASTAAPQCPGPRRYPCGRGNASPARRRGAVCRVLAAFGAARTGLPVLVAFLALGMLLGSEGPGGIEFDDAELAREVGIIGLARSSTRAACRPRGAGSARSSCLRPCSARPGWPSRAPRRRRRLRAARPLLARGLPARRGRCLDGRRGRLRDAALHAHPASPGAHARGRVGRQRPDGRRAHDGADRVDRATGDYGLANLAAPRRPADRPRPGRRHRARRRRDAGLRAPAQVARRVRARRLAAAAALAFGAADVDRRQWLPRGVPRRPLRRQHAVALPPPARRASTRARVPRPGDPLHRPRPARLPERAARRRDLGPRALSVLVLASAGRRLGSTAFSDFTASERCCSVGRACAAQCRSCSRRSRSRRTSRDANGSSTPSSSSSSSPRSSRAGRWRLAKLASSRRAAHPRAAARVRRASELDLIDFVVAPDHAIAGSAVRELGLPRSAIVAVVERGATPSRRAGAPSSSPVTAFSCSPPLVPCVPTSRTSSPLAAARLRTPRGFGRHDHNQVLP